MSAKSLALALVLSAALARAQIARRRRARRRRRADGGRSPTAAPRSRRRPTQRSRRARDEFDFGNYEGVVGAPASDRRGARAVARAAARRPIASRRCASTASPARSPAAAPPPRARSSCSCAKSRRRVLDPALVRPEAVAFFDEVRARHRAELLAAYRKNRRPYYWALDLIPLAGQMQNRQWKKAIVFGAIELALLGDATSRRASSSSTTRATTTPSPATPDAFEPLRDVNWISFGAAPGRHRRRCRRRLRRRCVAARTAIARPKRASATEARQPTGSLAPSWRVRTTFCRSPDVQQVSRLRLGARGRRPRFRLMRSRPAAIR